jgi:uncharacterized protein (TIGR03435 family)
MKAIITIICLMCCTAPVMSQEPLLKTGSRFPDLFITNIVNAPVKSVYINNPAAKRIYLLNFWGTWCSPCIPEMERLTVLQKNNADKIQVIGISDDNTERKLNFIKKKPTSIWLATDTAYTLYNMLGLANVGQCAVIGSNKKIIAVLDGDSINQQVIDKILAGKPVTSNARIKETAVVNTDDFGADSLTEHSFCIRSYMQGKQGMRRAPNPQYFWGRRTTAYNCSLVTLYSEAFDIHSPAQLLFDSSVDKKQLTDYNNKSNLYCTDLVVSPAQKDSILVIMQQLLNAALPIKARTEKRGKPVYVLKIAPGKKITFPVSKETASSYGFSGRGYDGTGIFLKDFAKNYLSNEMELPVVDETGLDARYDINFSINLRNKETLAEALAANGLMLEKAERQITVLFFYK